MFNWFRRKFDKTPEKPASETPPEAPADVPDVESAESEAEPAAVESEPSPDAESESAQETSAQTAAASPQAEDYLNWAKKAFVNIQQRQQEQTASAADPETTEESQTDTAEPVAVETPAQAEPEVVPDPEPEADSTPDIPTEPIDGIAIAEPAPPQVETIDEPTISEPEETPSASPASVAPTSAPIVPATPEPVPTTPEPPPSSQPAWLQRSDRLDALKETALETAPEEKSELPEFDEDFVWSAQVLAAQGRSPEEIALEEINWLKKLRQGLGKTRRNLVNDLKAIVGQGPLNRDAIDEIEALLLQADVGVEATDYVIETLQTKVRDDALPPEEAIAYLKSILQEILDKPLNGGSNEDFVPEKAELNIWLLTGVNGAGKTTTIGKLAHMAKASGYNSLIVAADTFRAAAVEQVKIWGDRSGTTVIANPGQNTDPAAVVFDGISAALSRNTELLLVDTAGRLQNKQNLMDELAKIRRIIDKKAPHAKVESLLVLDATLGQNGLRQAEVFAGAAQLSGVVLTKLDGSARGGVALAVSKQLDLPIRFIGAGEGIDDLRPFSSFEFVEALLSGD
ncbi:MAG: signal recognition particle-docking protein FtsY [Cyanobacteria bacterium P01_H01_bin.15]